LHTEPELYCQAPYRLRVPANPPVKQFWSVTVTAGASRKKNGKIPSENNAL